MKQDFNKQQYIVLMDGQGNQRRFLKRDIHSFYPAEEGSVIQTIIAVENSLNRGEIVEIGVQEKCEEVLRLLNGEPSPADISAFTCEIVEGRQNRAKEELANRTSQHNQRMQQLNQRYEDDLARIVPDLTRNKIELEKTKKTIEKSPVLQRAELAFQKAQTQKPDSLSHKVSMATFHTLAMGNAVLITQKPDQQRAVERAEDNVRSLQRNTEQQKVREEEAFNRHKTHLENQMNDSQMTPSDRDILAKKIRDYRLGHSEPEFKFRREQNAERYNQEQVPEREQERQHVRGFGLSRHRSRGGHDLER